MNLEQTYKQMRQYQYIYLISLIGFIITGIVLYPYFFFWDNSYIFNEQIVGGLPPTNWMGWFYPYFWDFLYQINKDKSSIGVFQNLVYWIAMPIIYVYLFPKSKTKIYSYWYLAFVSFPLTLFSMPFITNNTFMTVFLLIALVFFAIYTKKGKKMYLIFALVFLLGASFIRRDSLFLVIPFMVYFSYLLTNKKILFTILMSLLFLGTYQVTNHLITKDIPKYKDLTNKQITIDTIAITAFYDLLVMSYYKKELLLPDFILKEEFRDENRAKAYSKIRSESIYDLAFGWAVVDRLGRELLVSGTIWHSGLIVKNIIPIYLENIKYYLWLKLNVFYAYGFYLWWTLILSIFALILVTRKIFKDIFPKEIRHFCVLGILSSWLFSGVIMLSVLSVQLRYVVAPNTIMWVMSIYILYIISNNYCLTFKKKQFFVRNAKENEGCI